MGPRLLCTAGGAALSSFYVYQGLLATPFFGSGAFLWASVFACFLLALALGYGLGDIVARLAGPRRLELAAPRLAVAGGLSAWLAAYLLPTVCREVLARDPEWGLAAAAAVVLTSLVPGALLAAIVPSALRACLHEPVRARGKRKATSRLTASSASGTFSAASADETGGASAGGARSPSGRFAPEALGADPERGARAALRLLGLMTLGGVGGVALAAKPLLRADEVDVWMHAYASAGFLVLVGVTFLSALGKVLALALLAGLVGLSAARPSEIQRQEFAVALETAWETGRGASLYYRRTAHDELLDDDELQAHYERIARGAEVEKPGIILTFELLHALGEVEGVRGEGLLRSLDLLLSEEAKPYIMPIFAQVDSIHSRDGVLYVKIKRQRGVEGTRFHIPGADPGRRVRFWFRDDFTIRLIRERNNWKLEFGPLTTRKAGIFELHDTNTTPLRIENVALWVDASLLGLVVEDFPDQVVVRAVAQGDIGRVQTVDVVSISKESRGGGR